MKSRIRDVQHRGDQYSDLSSPPGLYLLDYGDLADSTDNQFYLMASIDVLKLYVVDEGRRLCIVTGGGSGIGPRGGVPEE